MTVHSVEGNLIAAFTVLRGKPIGIPDANLDALRSRMSELGFAAIEADHYKKIAPKVDVAAELVDAGSRPGVALMAFVRPMTFNVIAGVAQGNERPVVDAIRAFSATSHAVQQYDVGYRLHAPKLPKAEQAGLSMHARGPGGAMFR